MLSLPLMIAASASTVVILGVVMFTVVVIALVLLILAAKSQLVASGPVKIMINGQKRNFRPRRRKAAWCSR